MRLEWVGQSREDGEAGQLDPSRLVNCYRVANGDALYLRAVPGMTQMADLSDVFLRALEEINGTLYAVHGGKLASVASDGTITTLSASVTDSAQTTIAGNNGAVAVASGGSYAVWNGVTLSSPATGAFSSVGSVEFFEQRTFISELNGRRVSWSDVADATTFDALNFATAESRDDDIVRIMALGGVLWVFKQTSIEIWGGDGAGGYAILPGRVIDRGIKDFSLLTRIPGGAFFIGNDGVAYLAAGDNIQPVSTQAVMTAIDEKTPTHCLYYEDRGQKFAAIRFSDRAAWVYDLSTQEWHERAQGETLQPWQAITAARAYGKQIVGTTQAVLCELDRTQTDFGDPMVRKAVSRTLAMGGRRFRVARVDLLPVTGRAAGASLLYRVSRDRGETWGPQKGRTLGETGQYGQVVALRALGSGHSFNLEVVISAAADVPLSAIAEVQVA